MTQAQIGIMIEGQDGLNWERWRNILKTAEDSGYQCVFRSDHFTNASGEHKDALELWTSLTYAATHTQRIEFGPLVAPVTFRHPSMTVKYASAVDDLSEGRLVLGMGAGWQDREHNIFGIPFYDFPTRYEQLKDALEITKQLFESDEPVTYEGAHFSLDEAILLPRPQRKGGAPILIGGNGPKKTLPLVADYAKEWNAVFADHDTYKARTERLNQLLEERGRKPSDVKRSLMMRVIYGETDARVQEQLDAIGRTKEELQARGLIVGTANEIVEQVGVWVELGVERFMLQWIDQDDIAGLESMAQRVLPHFHGTA
jgi:F420-dependent oxidoreductase-like protein